MGPIEINSDALEIHGYELTPSSVNNEPHFFNKPTNHQVPNSPTPPDPIAKLE
jgi:hypothetical protein